MTMRAFEMAMTLLLVTSMLVASACGGTETGTSSGAEGSTPTGSSSASANGDATNNGGQSPRAADDVANGGQEVSDASRTEGADVTVPGEDTSTPTPSPDTTTPSEADGSGHTVPEADGHTVPEPVEDVGSVDDVTTGPDPEPQAPGIPWNAGPYGSKIMDPRHWMQGPGSGDLRHGIQDQGSGTGGRGSAIRDPGSRIRNAGFGTGDPRPEIGDP